MTRVKISLCTVFALILMTATYALAGGIHTGTVLESTSGGGYSYMKIDENGEKFWIAGPQTRLGKGDKVRFDEQMWMHDFHSKALDRKFDSIMFVGAIQAASSKGGSPSARPARSKTVRPAPTRTGKTAKTAKTIKSLKPADLYPVRELYAQKEELNGKLVRVKGKVIKVSSGILGRTWVHIQDGTIYMGNSKVIFTSRDDTAEVGSEITAQGRLEMDKDFGAGYFYSVIVEDSSFIK